MASRDICYVPDFVANRMGIVNCANEQYGRVGSGDDTSDPLVSVHLDNDSDVGVYATTLRVLEHAAAANLRPEQAADAMANAACTELHPLFGHRSKLIIDHLREESF